jgi:hypothetical protein
MSYPPAIRPQHEFYLEKVRDSAASRVCRAKWNRVVILQRGNPNAGRPLPEPDLRVQQRDSMTIMP